VEPETAKRERDWLSYAYIAASAILIMVLFYAISRKTFSNSDDVVNFVAFYGAPIVFLLAIFIAMIFVSRETRLVTAIALVSAFVAVYVAEIYIVYKRLDTLGVVKAAAEHAGIPFDARTARQVVDDFRAQDTVAYPAFRLVQRPEEYGAVFLGYMPRRTVVVCNELGQHFVMETDRYGFNNPDGIWEQGPASVVFVGDSFVFGHCVPKEYGQSFVDQIRGSVKGTVNLGMGSNGPLLNLATLTEFLPTLQPKHVVFFYYENDMNDLGIELGNNLLPRYLESEFSQNIIERSEEMTSIFEKYYEQNLATIYGQEVDWKEAFFRKDNFVKIFKLTTLRKNFGLSYFKPKHSNFLEINKRLSKFGEAMRRTRELVNEHGSKLVFVYLPSPDGLSRKVNFGTDEVLGIVKDLGFRVIDLRPVLARIGDMDQLYAFGRAGGHLTPFGNKLIADHLLREVFGIEPDDQRPQAQ
jgi:hypothetical protein